MTMARTTMDAGAWRDGRARRAQRRGGFLHTRLNPGAKPGILVVLSKLACAGSSVPQGSDDTVSKFPGSQEPAEATRKVRDDACTYA